MLVGRLILSLYERLWFRVNSLLDHRSHTFHNLPVFQNIQQFPDHQSFNALSLSYVSLVRNAEEFIQLIRFHLASKIILQMFDHLCF